MYSIVRVLVFLTFLLAFFIPALSQEPGAQDKETAKAYFEVAELVLTETKAIDEARDQMVIAADLDTTFIKANFMAGDLLLLTIGKELAVKYFMRVYRQDPDYRFDIEYLIGRSYQHGLEFDKAIEWYTRYKEKLKKKSNYQGRDKVPMSVVDRDLYECENGKEFVANPGNFSIVNIGREINSEYEDYAPVFNETEDEIVFTSRRRDGNLNENVDIDNKPFEDIYISRKKNGQWQPAVNIGPPVNTPSHGSNLALSADGGTLFIYKDENGGDIYRCELNSDGSWSEPIPLPGIINSSYEEKSITISKDEKTLYFTSNRPGGYGGTDVYKATKDHKGEWTNVKNLGPVINTNYDEEGPFIDYDGVTLYFSSQGHKGMGGHDVFRSKFDPDKNVWSEPVNLGYPINTPDDDVFFVASADGKKAYYSSVREDGMGYTDIFMITVPEGLKETNTTTASNTPKEPVVVEQPKEEPKEQSNTAVKPVRYIVKITDDTGKPTDATVRLQNVSDNTTTSLTNTGPGVYEFKSTEPTSKDYQLSVQKQGFVPVNQKITIMAATAEDKVINKPVKLSKADIAKQPEKKEVKPLRYIVKVTDETGKPTEAKLKLQGAQDNVIVPLKNVGPGTYEFRITSTSPRNYRLSIEKEGYIFENQTLRITGASAEDKAINKSVQLRKLMVGARSVLRNIYFDINRATFKNSSYNELNKLLTMMKQNQRLQVEISGHTDNSGPSTYNEQLSRKRAEAVKDFLTSRGIDPRRIRAVGYGETKPLASNDDETDGRQLNRRVEFKVLGN